MATSAGAASFIPLGDLPGSPFFSEVRGMSADGSVVVGRGFTAPNQDEAFVWTQAGGMQSLGSLGDASRSTGLSRANGVSPNGGIVVGQTDAPNNAILGFTWTAAGGLQGLPDLSGASDYTTYSEARAISANGAVVVGDSQSDAVFWDATGIHDLGRINSDLGVSQDSSATGVNADGSIVIGYNVYKVGNVGQFRAFTWTPGGGMQQLLDPTNPSIVPEIPWYVSPDGSVVVGRAAGPSGSTDAFLWTSGGGLQTLGHLPGTSSATAFSATPDGSIVVGTTDSGLYGFIWDPVHGMRDLETVLLQDYGLSTSFRRISDVRAISADGLFLAGNGVNASGQSEGFFVSLPEPEPVFLLLMVLIMLAIVGKNGAKAARQSAPSHLV